MDSCAFFFAMKRHPKQAMYTHLLSDHHMSPVEANATLDISRSSWLATRSTNHSRRLALWSPVSKTPSSNHLDYLREPYVKHGIYPQDEEDVYGVHCLPSSDRAADPVPPGCDGEERPEAGMDTGALEENDELTVHHGKEPLFFRARPMEKVPAFQTELASPSQPIRCLCHVCVRAVSDCFTRSKNIWNLRNRLV